MVGVGFLPFNLFFNMTSTMGNNVGDIAAMDHLVNAFIAKATEVYGEGSEELDSCIKEVKEAGKAEGVTGQIGSMAASNLVGHLTREMHPSEICELHMNCLIGHLFMEVTHFVQKMELQSPDLVAMIHDSSILHMLGILERMSPKKVRPSKADFWMCATFNDLTTSKWKVSNN